jgi:hypothetical protein
MLLGTWENLRDVGFILANYIHETYEFTPSGGSIVKMRYFPDEDRYEEYYTRYFTDWSYEGETIYFMYKKGRSTERWQLSIRELTSESVRFGGIIYYKVK